ncbi:MAG: hypothetical protein ACPG31_06610 [Planctomycetota bacterium]
MPRRLLSVVALLTGVGLLLFTLYAASDPAAFRRDLTMQWKMEAIEADVFARTDLPKAKRASLMEQLQQARAANDAFYGTRRAAPTIAFADNAALKESLAVGNPFAATFYHRDGILAVVTPRGLNGEVMAHMLSHAEIKERLGAEVFETLPAWFDEGLATLLDDRPFLADAALDAKEAEGVETPPFEVMAEREWFVGTDAEAHLVLAKLEVRRWYRLVGQQGVVQLLDRLAAGEDFERAYREAEAAAGWPE